MLACRVTENKHIETISGKLEKWYFLETVAEGLKNWFYEGEVFEQNRFRMLCAQLSIF